MTGLSELLCGDEVMTSQALEQWLKERRAGGGERGKIGGGGSRDYNDGRDRIMSGR